MNTAIIYQSKYGATKRYAEWISEELRCPLFEHSQIGPDELDEYELIIYGGGMYAGSIAGVKRILCNYNDQLIVFTTGLSDPTDADIPGIAKQNALGDTKLFVFRGGYDFDKLSFPHKLVMRIARKAMSKGKSEEEKAAMHGKVLDFTDRAAIAPLIEYVRRNGKSFRTRV